jgi:transcriptional regulator with XRE-family HTH domain
MKQEDSSEGVAEIARRCRYLRIAIVGDERGSQSAFARKIGMPSPNNWNNYEREFGRPSLDVAIQLVSQFGVSLDWIYLGSEGLMPPALMKSIREVARSEGLELPRGASSVETTRPVEITRSKVEPSPGQPIQITVREDSSCRLVVDTITSSQVARKVWELLDTRELEPR